MKSIKLSNNVYVHVFIHEIKRSMEEFVLSSEDCSFPDFEREAEEYIDALEEHWCVAFLEALHKVSARKIVEHWEQYAPQQLETEHFKPYLKFKK